MDIDFVTSHVKRTLWCKEDKKAIGKKTAG
jgi:hypothetical protein